MLNAEVPEGPLAVSAYEHMGALFEISCSLISQPTLNSSLVPASWKHSPLGPLSVGLT